MCVVFMTLLLLVFVLSYGVQCVPIHVFGILSVAALSYLLFHLLVLLLMLSNACISVRSFSIFTLVV